jgi:hypothetical protein
VDQRTAAEIGVLLSQRDELVADLEQVGAICMAGVMCKLSLVVRCILSNKLYIINPT